MWWQFLTYGFVHGGLISALADNAMGMVYVPSLDAFLVRKAASGGGVIKVNERTDKDGHTTRTLDIELYDKVGVLRLLAKASGLLDNPEESDKPSVIDVNVVAPAPRGEQ